MERQNRLEIDVRRVSALRDPLISARCHLDGRITRFYTASALTGQ